MKITRQQQKNCPICLNSYCNKQMKKCTKCDSKFCNNCYYNSLRPSRGTCSICNRFRYPQIQKDSIFMKKGVFYKVTNPYYSTKQFKAIQISKSNQKEKHVEIYFTLNEKDIKWKIQKYNSKTKKWSRPQYLKSMNVNI